MSIKKQIEVLKETIKWFRTQIEPHDCGWMYTTPTVAISFSHFINVTVPVLLFSEVDPEISLLGFFLILSKSFNDFFSLARTELPIANKKINIKVRNFFIKIFYQKLFFKSCVLCCENSLWCSHSYYI